jgi:hypothetical protein
MNGIASCVAPAVTSRIWSGSAHFCSFSNSYSLLAKWQNGRLIRVAPEPGSAFNPYLTTSNHNIGADGYLFGLWRRGWLPQKGAMMAYA